MTPLWNVQGFLAMTLLIQTQEKLLCIVNPAKAGIQAFNLFLRRRFETWTPAFAGVTTLAHVTFFNAFVLVNVPLHLAD